ncbi:hypothetical protein O1611_g291 [Lasiodiplodia mahajangana]|uniref:Uncharacterized protein n=1 Tax=Lasiodiplodia mahajangana TaxID=1108764 RepID=A0ACC2K0K8_9PEZI|nr:hypothetical protein O1611_g291 [Lasiodiplodia mahajangana]
MIGAGALAGAHFPYPLCEAIRYGRWPIAAKLLERGANADHPVEEFCVTPLVAACMSVYTPIEFIVFLIERGARIDEIPDRTCIPPYLAPCKGTDDFGWYTPLSCAASSGNLNVASLLLGKGANVNATCRSYGRNEWTALDAAASKGRLDMVQLLLGMGGLSADRGTTGVDGAIRAATEEGHYGVAEFLQQRRQSNEPGIIEPAEIGNGDTDTTGFVIDAGESDQEATRDTVHEVDREDLETQDEIYKEQQGNRDSWVNRWLATVDSPEHTRADAPGLILGSDPYFGAEAPGDFINI